MTQRINTQTANVCDTVFPSFHGKTRQAESSFDLILGSSQRTKQDAPGSGTSAAKPSKANQIRTASPVTAAGSEAKAEMVRETGKDMAKDTKDLSKDTKKDTRLPDRIMELLNSIWQAVRDVLHLSQEKLQQLMEEQGIESTDLLNPDFLRQLVLANSGQDAISAVLTDEDLADSMKQLLQTVEGLCADSGLDRADDSVKDILAQLENLDFLKKTTDSETSDAVALDTGDSAAAGRDQELLSAANVAEDALPGQIRKEDKEKEAKTLPAESGPEKGGKGRVPYEETTGSGAVEEDPKLSRAGEGSSGFLSDRRNDSRETASTDRFADFVDRMMDAAQRNLSADFNEDLTQITELREIANQIINQIRVVVRQDQTSMELQLNPENLGKVNLSVRSKEGVMTAQFVVQNELTKEAIESQMYTLKDTLEQQGIKVETIEVTVAHYAFEQNNQADSQREPRQQKSSGGKKITLEEAMQMGGEPLQKEAEAVDITGMRGSQIDFTA